MTGRARLLGGASWPGRAGRVATRSAVPAARDGGALGGDGGSICTTGGGGFLLALQLKANKKRGNAGLGHQPMEFFWSSLLGCNNRRFGPSTVESELLRV